MSIRYLTGNIKDEMDVPSFVQYKRIENGKRIVKDKYPIESIRQLLNK
jgi:hypothetical protein